MKRAFIGLVVLVFGVVGAWAVPTQADQNGCYVNAKGRRSCHAMRAQFDRKLPGGETQSQRDKRLKRECKGKPNAGACLGYAKP